MMHQITVQILRLYSYLLNELSTLCISLRLIQFNICIDTQDIFDIAIINIIALAFGMRRITRLIKHVDQQ